MSGSVLEPVVVGRHSIHDGDLTVVGYELRFGSHGDAGFDGPPGSAGIALGALNLVLDRLVGDKQVFVDVQASMLTDPTRLALLPVRSVIEVQPSAARDRRALQGCRDLADLGFGIAVDGLTSIEDALDLLEIATIAKIDTQLSSAEQIRELAPRCRRLGVKVLADKVGHRSQVDEFRDCGVELFQGHVLQRPTVENGKRIGAVNLAKLRMSASVLSAQLDFFEIEELLRTEPGMTYQVLQLASLGRVGETRRQIGSLREALVLAGAWRIQSWISMLLACPSQDVAGEEVAAALARARACELLCASVGASPRTGFAAGMISSFEQLLQVPAAELRETLPLSDELREAAFGGDSDLGRLVSDVVESQSGTHNPRRLSPVSSRELETALAAALAWALEATSCLG